MLCMSAVFIGSRVSLRFCKIKRAWKKFSTVFNGRMVTGLESKLSVLLTAHTPGMSKDSSIYTFLCTV